jgi:sugar phosphate isomerase/epimerase
MWSRRAFLQAGAAAMLAARNLPGVKLGAQTNAWPIKPGDLNQFFDVLNKIKTYGFQGFETGYANLRAQFEAPAESKSRIQATGLDFFGIHIFLTQYDPQTYVAPAVLYEEVARGGAKLGAQRLILSGAPAAGNVNAKAAALNRAGGFAKSVGMQMAAYHNHAPEFHDGAAEMLALMSDTNPDEVGFLLDAGHAYEAGADVPKFFSEHHQRIIGLHLRDYKNGEQVPLGSGTFPLSELATAIQRVQWRGWVLCEEERLHGKPGDAAMKPARDALFRVFRGEA